MGIGGREVYVNKEDDSTRRLACRRELRKVEYSIQEMRRSCFGFSLLREEKDQDKERKARGNELSNERKGGEEMKI
jgi:hypothetical protein